jgi:serine protease AprX
MYRSISTIKADAARRSYDSLGEDITWAVLSTGVDGRHPHFQTHDTLGGNAAGLHRDFTKPGSPRLGGARVDRFGHGSHVAGIIAGGLPADLAPERVLVFERDLSDPVPPRGFVRQSVRPEQLSGMAPRCKLVSLKVLDDRGNAPISTIIQALRYVRTEVNGGGRLLRVQGVNISLGYEFDSSSFACGQSPLCIEVEQLVRSGVVVVVASGNTGYGRADAMSRITSTGFLLTINDPGNAELAITVGSTHRDQPHRYGVSYFSSKGPTLDGRLKPDLVAPGEQIVSCAVGNRKRELKERGEKIASTSAVYVDDNGTSMATAHVSGAVAAFLSVHREFIGRPDEVKRIFLQSATSLGRRPEFQGHGLVDLMRALQNI